LRESGIGWNAIGRAYHSEHWANRHLGEDKAKVYYAGMDEGRKRVIGIMAGILAARKLAQYNGGKRVPATVSAIPDAIRWAEEIMKEIDERFRGNHALVGSPPKLTRVWEPTLLWNQLHY
jgi:hypothetical protein